MSDPRLGELLDGIIRLAAGDLRCRVKPSPARDEIDAVITGINLLADDLQLVYEELEARVESRTALLREAHREMERMAMTDALTSLANRAALLAAIDRELAAAAAGGPPPALLMVDLDSFKGINDSHGHGAGDQVLTGVAERLRESARETDVVARLGGDEFAILIPGASLAGAMNVGERIFNALNGGLKVGHRNIVCRASIGLRMAERGQGAQELLQEADVAMYAAKAEGSTKVKVFEPFMLHAQQLRNMLAAELRRAISEDQLVLHYQPIIELATGRIEGVEALVRWQHPDRGLIMPDEFIAVAEEIGVVAELGRWVIGTALAQLRGWKDSLELDERFSVRINISPFQLQSIEFVDDIWKALRSADIKPANLILELTESVFVGGTELDRYSILGLRQLGVGLEIDDFGTGYSSISYLRRLPVDKVKIDRSLLGEPAQDPQQRAFLTAILQLVRACRLEAVFEGIENRSQAEELQRLGAESAQGYYFSRPLPAERILDLLGRSPADQPWSL